jgi:hypothetical protein
MIRHEIFLDTFGIRERGYVPARRLDTYLARNTLSDSDMQVETRRIVLIGHRYIPVPASDHESVGYFLTDLRRVS